jgi:amino acid transporter
MMDEGSGVLRWLARLGGSLGCGLRYMTLITSYIALPLYLFLVIGYKVVTRCKSVNPAEADLWTVTTIRERHETRPKSPRRGDWALAEQDQWLWNRFVAAWLL